MKQFNQFIGEFKAGHMNDALTDELGAVTNAAVHFGKVGELTIKIKVTPKIDGEVITSVKFDSKMPRRDEMESIMYASPDGSLLHSDPNQASMFDMDNVKVVGDKPAAVSKSL